MNMSKDTLEALAMILRENGYEVSLKESNNETKKPYVSNKFNKIRDLDLNDLSYDTCVFLKAGVVGDFERHDYVAGSCDVTIGYISHYYDEEADFNEENIIKTNRKDTANNTIVERLSDYHYVIKLSDVFKLMASNEDFND